MKKTKAIEILTDAKCKFDVLSFDATEFTAEEVSNKLNLPLDIIYKTLVVQTDKKDFIMAVVPATHELNMKKLSNAAGAKKCDLAAISDMQRITGYLKGGCSPLGSKKTLPVYIDSSAEPLEKMVVSAGQRGLQICIEPKELAKHANAKFAELC